MKPLAAKNVVVVGGGTGIGRGIAHAFAAAGCKVLAGGRRNEKLQETAKLKETAELPEQGILTDLIDVTDRDSVNQFFAAAMKQLGNIDVVVNSAGMNIKTRTMSEMTPEQWDQVMLVNATGGYNVMHAVLPHMRKQADGLIVNVSSVAGKRALTLAGVAYCASKFAMTALGTAVGNEDAPNGIRITNIYPGEVETPILEQRPAPVSAQRRAQMLQPADVGEMIVAIAALPPRAHVPELVIKPTVQEYC